METLELRRTKTRRETTVYVLGIVYLVAAIVSVWTTAWLWVDIASMPAPAPTSSTVVLAGGGLVVTLLTLVILWLAAPAWQLILLPGKAEDVVVRADGHGLVLRDAGYTIEVPWTSVASLRIEPWRPDEPALVPVVAGQLSGSKDPLAWLVARGLRKGLLKFGLGPDDPTPDEVRVAVHELSGGALEVA
ncbi:MAG: hypothetical protein ACRDO4_08295 [Nocardioides sp.]